MLDRLQNDELRAAASACGLGDMDIVVHVAVDSTIDWALQQVRSGRPLPFACYAESQSRGRGRRGKQWCMPAHANIAMSLAWPSSVPGGSLQSLPLSIAIAIVTTLERAGLKDVAIKWPNDIYAGGMKLAGILIETRPLKQSVPPAADTADRRVAIVIGVGLNYDMKDISQRDRDLIDGFTDISEQARLHQLERPGRSQVASELLKSVIHACQRFETDAAKNLDLFRRSYDYFKGKAVDIILDDGSRLSGIAQGINDSAELQVEIDGRLCVFSSADVSVRPGQLIDLK